MSLEYYEHYWKYTSSDSSKERARFTNNGNGEGGEPIAAQTAVVQDKMLEQLKELLDNAGIDDWVAEIDHTITYQSQKQQILDRYGIQGFETDRKKNIEKWEAEQQQLREEAPKDAPMSLDEQMRRERSDDNTTQHDDVETKKITGRDETSSQISSLNEIRKNCTKHIEEAYNKDGPIIIDALPGMGKTHGAIKAANSTNTSITIFVGRGNQGQYQEIEDWCEKYNLSNKILPSSYNDCPTISGKHGNDISNRQQSYLSYGLTASVLHDHQDLPCERNSSCPYIDAWDFDPADFDVLIGHYLHAHVSDVTENRTVVFDEFPGDTFVTELDNKQYITEFLKDNNGLPFDNYVDLLTNRIDDQKRSTAIDWFRNRGFGLKDISSVLSNNLGNRHALASLGVLALLQTKELDNGWESGPLREVEWAVFNQEDSSIYLLRPPSLSQAEGVIGLSGTPVYRFWDLVIGLEFGVERVLDNKKRRDYVWNIQNLQIIQTEREHIYPYSSGYHADPERDAALIEEIHNEHDVVPTIITSRKALAQIKQTGIQIDSDSTYYGNIRGSNKLQNKDVGVILGSPHPGDNEIEKWAALLSDGASRGDTEGANLTYGPFGDRVLAHLRENEVLQSIFRFARDGSGATVYVNTAAIPSWLPRQWAIGFFRKRNKNELSVIEELRRNDGRSGTKIANSAGIHPNTARDHLRRLEKEGVVRKSGKSRGTKWHNEGLDSINEEGLIDLTPITEILYNIHIGDFGGKHSQDMEEYILAEQARERKITEQEIEEIRNPSTTYTRWLK